MMPFFGCDYVLKYRKKAFIISGAFSLASNVLYGETAENIKNQWISDTSRKKAAIGITNAKYLYIDRPFFVIDRFGQKLLQILESFSLSYHNREDLRYCRAVVNKT